MKITQRPYYKQTGKESEVFRHAFTNKLPVLIKGPTGSGKSRFIEHMAWELEQELFTIACHEETSATDLIGRYIIKGAETVWIDGPLTKAVKNGAIIYLDEIAEARPDVIVAIHSLTDHRRSLFIDKLGEEIQASEKFMLVASYNPGYQKGMKELKPSTRQRFIAMHFNYPDPITEAEIIQRETQVSEETAKKLVKVGAKIRNLTELGLMETVSTRLLVDAAKLMNSGLPPRLSADVSIVQPLTDDDTTGTALRDIISLSF
ncbi:CbbQ/NirQ/NorQ/GpvN family protein [Cytophagaceae bacterium ABcell3]|nr:CbbQ/NirQ/NorQ/GpvN family protein [Cytophagaceae bacterium ABcell3]